MRACMWLQWAESSELLIIIPYHTPSVFNLFTEHRQDLLTNTHPRTLAHGHTPHALTPTHDTLHLERIICPASVSGSTVFGRKRPVAKIGRSRPLSILHYILTRNPFPFVCDVRLLSHMPIHIHSPSHTHGLKNRTLFHIHKQVAQICAQSKGCDRIFLQRIGLR